MRDLCPKLFPFNLLTKIATTPNSTLGYSVSTACSNRINSLVGLFIRIQFHFQLLFHSPRSPPFPTSSLPTSFRHHITMSISQEALDQLFFSAHTEHGFAETPVDVAEVEKVLLTAQMGPTAYNSLPLRVVFVHTADGKAKLIDTIKDKAPGNVNQTTQAPVNAILCVDTEFEDKLDYLMPVVPGASGAFKGPHHDAAMNLNGTLTAGYFILALRAAGYGVGPQVTVPGVDEAFLSETTWKSICILNIGHGVEGARYPRAPKHTIEQASKRV